MMIEIDTETLFPDGLSDEVVSAISAVLYEVASQWENAHYYQLREFDRQQRIRSCDPLQPWRKKNPG